MYTTELLARQGDKGISDKITVRNLQVTVNAGADAWGRKKIQPALLTVTLFLSEPFDTAAQADSLDDSTVHYGILSKSIKSQVESNTEHRPTPKLAWEIYSCVDKTAGRTLLRAVEVEIFYPKASLLGDGAGHKLSLIFRGEDRTVYDSSELFYLRNVRIPCVIGVNANERLQKQPVVVNLWMENMGDPWSDECTNVEGCLTDVRNFLALRQWLS
jgi:dihydroneopterin aldolase